MLPPGEHQGTTFAPVRGMLGIGQFSVLTRLSIRTLRRYDAQGLLMPGVVDPVTRRRYYSPAQAADAHLIRLLRELDVPLPEVRSLLERRDPGSTRQRLLSHRQQVADGLRRQADLLAALDGLLEDLSPLTRPVVVTRPEPERRVLCVRTTTTLDDLPHAAAHAFDRITRQLARHHAPPAGPPLAVYHGDEFDPGRVDVQFAVPVTELVPPDGSLGHDVLPAIEAAATTLHAGPYAGIGRAYRVLGEWLAAQGREAGGAPRELYLVGPERAGADGLRTEVVWPLA